MPQERIDKLIAPRARFRAAMCAGSPKAALLPSMAAPCGMPGKKPIQKRIKSLFPAGLFLFPNIFISCSINPQASCPRAGMQNKKP